MKPKSDEELSGLTKVRYHVDGYDIVLNQHIDKRYDYARELAEERRGENE